MFILLFQEMIVQYLPRFATEFYEWMLSKGGKKGNDSYKGPKVSVVTFIKSSQ